MKDELKKVVGNWVIKLGERAVGKCMIPGMYDPQIPKELKEDILSIENSISCKR